MKCYKSLPLKYPLSHINKYQLNYKMLKQVLENSVFVYGFLSHATIYQLNINMKILLKNGLNWPRNLHGINTTRLKKWLKNFLLEEDKSHQTINLFIVKTSN